MLHYPSLSKCLHCCWIIRAYCNDRRGFDALFQQSMVSDFNEGVCSSPHSGKFLETENNRKLWYFSNHASIYTSPLSIFPSIHQISEVVPSLQTSKIFLKNTGFLCRKITLHEHIACSRSVGWPQNVDPFHAKVILCCREWNISMYEKSRADLSTK